MIQAKSGDLVKVHYTGTFGDGTVFDTSEGGDPLEFILGSGQVIPGFDQAIEGMKLGAFDYLMKPCDIEVLIGKVKGAASKKREHEEKITEARIREITERRV